MALLVDERRIKHSLYRTMAEQQKVQALRQAEGVCQAPVGATHASPVRSSCRATCWQPWPAWKRSRTARLPTHRQTYRAKQSQLKKFQVLSVQC